MTQYCAPRIVCVTGPAPAPFSDVVTVNASKEGTSRERFSYVVRGPAHRAHRHACLVPSLTTRLPSQLPQVHSLEPAMGPTAGGTQITIRGSDLHVGSELQVLVNDTDRCTELV